MPNKKHNINSWLFILAITLRLFIPLSIASEKADSVTKGFPERLDEAYQSALKGAFNKSFKTFEELITSNPDEPIVYDLYAQAVETKAIFMDQFPERKENYKKAISIYERWLNRKSNKSEHNDQAYARIKEIQNKADFVDVIKRAVPWEQARVFGTGQFIVTTNLPQHSYESIVKDLRWIMQNEEDLFASLFGKPLEIRKDLKVFISGEWKDYQKIAYRPHRYGAVAAKAFYYHEDGRIGIFFDGALNTPDLAHEVGHYYVSHYIENASSILHEGFSEYASYKLAKEIGKARIVSKLENLQWLYQQGRLENIFDFEGDFHEFYTKAWIFVLFFVEGADETYRNLFKEYLVYEKNNSLNDEDSLKSFFESRLNEDQLRELNHEWQDFALGLNFERI